MLTIFTSKLVFTVCHRHAAMKRVRVCANNLHVPLNVVVGCQTMSVSRTSHTLGWIGGEGGGESPPPLHPSGHTRR